MHTRVRARQLWLCGILVVLALIVVAVWFVPIRPGGMFHYPGFGAVGESYLQVKDGQVRVVMTEGPPLKFGTYEERHGQWVYVSRGGTATCVMKTTVRGLTLCGSEWFPRAFFWKRIDDGLPDSREAERAQLIVTVGTVSVVGQDALVPLGMTNELSEKVELARAICSLYDEQRMLVGQATRWIVGGSNTNGLAAGATNFSQVVITGDKPFATTNLRARVRFDKVLLEGGNLADLTKQVSVTSANK
jgi:hypothetical protein